MTFIKYNTSNSDEQVIEVIEVPDEIKPEEREYPYTPPAKAADLPADKRPF